MAEDLSALATRIRHGMRSATAVEPALVAGLEAVCRETGIPYGEAWTPYNERPALYLRAAWHRAEHDFGDFIAASRRIALAPGVGSAGRIWASGRPEIFENIRQAPTFSRRAPALDAGFRALVGLPVACEGRVGAVVIFLLFEFRDEWVRPIERAAEIMGPELSRFLPADRGDPGSDGRTRQRAA